jgi:hypothetical protein
LMREFFHHQPDSDSALIWYRIVSLSHFEIRYRPFSRLLMRPARSHCRHCRASVLYFRTH